MFDIAGLIFWRIFSSFVDGLFLLGVLNNRKIFGTGESFRKKFFLFCYIFFCVFICIITREWNCFYSIFAFLVPISFLVLNSKEEDKFSISCNIVIISCVHTVAVFCCTVVNIFVNSLPWKSFIYTHDVRVVARYALQAILYSLVLYFLYIKKIFDGSYMKHIASHVQAPVLFLSYFAFGVYLKYKIAFVGSSGTDKTTLNVLYTIYLFLIPIFLMTYWLLAKLSSLKNVIQNGEYDEVFENVAVMPVHSSKINFSPDLYAYEKDKVIFRKKLANLGITNMDCGYSHLVFSLIALSYLPEKEQVNIEKDILERVAEFIHKDPSVLRTEINNIIHKVWTQGDIETLKWGYEYSNNVKHKVPTVDEFLIHMVNKAS